MKHLCQRCRSHYTDGLEITEDTPNNTKHFINKTYYHYLCNSCINEITNLLDESLKVHFPTKREEFIEGVHYYQENQYFVFTELYHIQKGHCCQSRCRHCAYGFK